MGDTSIWISRDAGCVEGGYLLKRKEQKGISAGKSMAQKARGEQGGGRNAVRFYRRPKRVKIVHLSFIARMVSNKIVFKRHYVIPFSD